MAPDPEPFDGLPLNEPLVEAVVGEVVHAGDVEGGDVAGERHLHSRVVAHLGDERTSTIDGFTSRVTTRLRD